MDVIFSTNQLRLSVVLFMIAATYQAGLFGRNNFGINPLDFGTKRGASIIGGLTPTEVPILRHGADSTCLRPEAARFFYVAASPGFEGAPKIG
jgi:hypothetical protein